MSWVVVPAAGRGSRFGGAVPKQYLSLFGRSVLHHTLDRLARHPEISGLVVALSAQDAHWPGWREMRGKPVLRCEGGRERADSVLAGLRALPDAVRERDWVLVHDAARPCLRQDDLSRLLEHGRVHGVGAILAAPVRDTLKRATADGEIAGSEPRERLWRALTPQMFRRATLTRALESALAAGAAITDEAMAVERIGLKPLLVEGAEDNLKITTEADLPMAEFLLGRLGSEA
ncbi:2-C-methyl-D-erythritol 4-phosphate cytidylyltransferase [Pseudomarimonas salicorniae]|uniref:2-C-methyl-D-erythritol 4-phosphate cytidylyltransferase n=1 Tax=Pseudomarimonas salicorniae TaxID=2933270 RepID=A0ABT0GH98_9GAMM|nr:2-C-methyl-D-erythritol 4-phosphate cytidylyltransferase [Lysobacter sp. CAU 1642]MCK7593803.1 2-C-methyl-D-erythritol 4-phosphate cytidylyltransferase [Lysobacter sp. CAU 1642]